MEIKHDIVPSNITNRLSFNFIFANLRLEFDSTNANAYIRYSEKTATLLQNINNNQR